MFLAFDLEHAQILYIEHQTHSKHHLEQSPQARLEQTQTWLEQRNQELEDSGFRCDCVLIGSATHAQSDLVHIHAHTVFQLCSCFVGI